MDRLERREEWRRIDGVKKYARGGILAQATTLAQNSGASRTSPILRGHWIAETLLGDKLPRPPKDVPPLPAEEATETLTVRELTEKHSSDPRCAHCHDRMDAFGFALEGFDARPLVAGGDMGAAYLLPRLVGYGRATELLMLGDTIDAETADRYGLVTHLTDDLDGACEMLARRLADGPTLGLQQTKSLITRELDMPLGPAMELDAMTQALLMTSEDHAEFHAAFNAKRKPDWKGR